MIFAILGTVIVLIALAFGVRDFLRARREEREWREIQRAIDEGREEWWGDGR